MKQFFCLFCILVGLNVSAQTTLIKVLDAGSKDPLPRTTIFFGDSSQRFTDDKGICKADVKFPTSARVSYVGYKTQLISLKKFKQDTIIVLLVRDKQQLKEVTVLPELPKYLFFGSPDLQVIDYEFIDQYLLVGVFHNATRTCSLLVLDSNNKIVDEQPLPADFERLYISGIQKYYAVSGSVIQEIQFRKGIVILKEINSSFFYDKVVYYKGYYKDYLYIMDTHVSKQVHFYYVEHVEKPENTIRLMTILGNRHTYNAYQKDDSFNQVLRQAELKQLHAMVGSTADDGYYQTETKGEFVRTSYMDIKYKDQYSQLFVVDSTVYVFDFIQGNLKRFADDGEPLTSSPIGFHQQPGWKRYVQRSDAGYYTAYESEKYLKVARLEPDFSGIAHEQILYHPNPLQWKVHNGYVYYLDTPVGYSLNVFLFREVLQ